MRYQGTLRTWKDDKGFGFVEIDGSPKEVFVHIRAFQTKTRRPMAGDRLSFVIHPAADGRWHAAEVCIDGEKPTTPTRKIGKANTPRISQIKIYLALGFMLVVFTTVLFLALPWYWCVIYAVLNLVTFIAYAQDKGAAEQGHWRTPESTLHTLALMSGWPGALIAQQLLRHKSSKVEFQSLFWLTVIVNSLGLMLFLWWLHTPK